MSEREAFEAWATSKGLDIGSLNDGVRYWSLETQWKWEVWQAAWRASREQALGEAGAKLREGLHTNGCAICGDRHACADAIEALRDKK